jgi:hypothetical protein
VMIFTNLIQMCPCASETEVRHVIRSIATSFSISVYLQP